MMLWQKLRVSPMEVGELVCLPVDVLSGGRKPSFGMATQRAVARSEIDDAIVCACPPAFACLSCGVDLLKSPDTLLLVGEGASLAHDTTLWRCTDHIER